MVISTSTRSRVIKNLDDYYKVVMDDYAEAGEGLLCPLVENCPDGDFAYAPYKWTPPQKLAWKLDRKAPCHINDLPGNPVLLFQSIHFPSEEERVRDTTATEPGVKNSVIDIRISKKQFLRLEEITTPGLRVWVREEQPSACTSMLSNLFVFTEEEKMKYREDKFKEDGTDLPTIMTLVERVEARGVGKARRSEGMDNAADSMKVMVGLLKKEEKW